MIPLDSRIRLLSMTAWMIFNPSIGIYFSLAMNSHWVCPVILQAVSSTW